MGNIQWYPGHMAKAHRLIEENIKLTDCVLYVLDARAPNSCINPQLDAIIKDKPCLYLLNKSDSSDAVVLKKWQTYFAAQNKQSILTDGRNLGSGKKIIEAVKKLKIPKLENLQRRGAMRSIRAMVIGVPNSGKSTIINTLCKEKRAQTGNKPGVTKGKQWVKIDENIDLLDMPGTLWSNLENQDVALNLALIGSVKQEILDITYLTNGLIDILKTNYAELFKQKYKLTDLDKPNNLIIEDICKSRGYLQKGEKCDVLRCNTAIADDFRNGKIGKIILEFPPN